MNRAGLRHETRRKKRNALAFGYLSCFIEIYFIVDSSIALDRWAAQAIDLNSSLLSLQRRTNTRRAL